MHDSFLTYRETLQKSTGADKDALVESLKRETKVDNKADSRPPSPTGKGTSPLTVREPGSQYPPKPPRLAPSPTPSVSPLVKRRKAEAGRTSPSTRVNIPIILVEEPMETECVANRSNATSKTRRKERRVRNKGGSVQPRSPEEGTTYCMRLLL